MVMIGHSGLRFVCYPVSRPDPADGLATLNWIANLNYEPGQAWNKEDWNREARLDDFLPRFEGMRFDWLDAPALVRAVNRSSAGKRSCPMPSIGRSWKLFQLKAASIAGRNICGTGFMLSWLERIDCRVWAKSRAR